MKNKETRSHGAKWRKSRLCRNVAACVGLFFVACCLALIWWASDMEGDLAALFAYFFAFITLVTSIAPFAAAIFFHFEMIDAEYLLWQ